MQYVSERVSDVSVSHGSIILIHMYRCLASDEDFSVVSVEVWGFVTKR